VSQLVLITDGFAEVEVGEGEHLLEGQLVEICDLSLVRCQVANPLIGQAEYKEVDVSGKAGRCLAWLAEPESAYQVLTFDGLLVSVPEGNLKEYDPPEPEFGGFDVTWPTGEWEHALFAGLLAESLGRKGYCMVQMFFGGLDPDFSAQAKEAAQALEYRMLEAEIAPAYLGEENLSKVAQLPAPAPGSAFGLCDEAFAVAGQLLQPISRAALNFGCSGRSSTLVRLPAQDMSPGNLSRSDVQEGTVEGLLHFLKRRKLSMLYLADCPGGGEVRFYPREDLHWGDTKVPIASNRLLIFRHDLMGYAFEPQGENLVLQSWLYSESLELIFDSVHGGDMLERKTILGATGPKEPEGENTRVSAMALRIAGNSDSAAQEWCMILSGTDGLTAWPPERWDSEPYFHSDEQTAMATGRSYNNHGAFCSLDKFTMFDPLFFGYAEEDVPAMGPEQRIVLEVGYECLAKMGRTREMVRGTTLGMVMACYNHSWIFEGPKTPCLYQGSDTSFTAQVLPHFLGTKGPSKRIDTACSSGIVATSCGDHDLRWRRKGSETLVMACMGQLNPQSWAGLCVMGMLSHKGRCFTYDLASDGFAKGEGCSAIFLGWDMEEERRVATLAGSFINQDGRSASMTAPNGPSQREMTKNCMEVAKISPADLSVSETHGTGTALGDPIEVGALRAALDGFRVENNPIMITTVKTNLSHMEANAGLSGVVKVSSMLRHGGIPGQVHLKSLNPHLDMEGFPWYIISEFTDPCRSDQFIGVQGFGMGGTNARADFWGRCREGVRQIEGPKKLNFEKADFCHVPCPKCMGPMCWLCSTAIPKYGLEKGRHHCSLIREGPADYEFCSTCFDGQYVYGKPVEEPFYRDMPVFIIGTWCGWSSYHEMRQTAPGVFICSLELGDSLEEEFHFALGQSENYAFYPLCKRAGPSIRISGPDEECKAHNWLIDGRKDGSSAGTVYKIVFTWSQWSGQKSVEWEVADDDFLPQSRIQASAFAHKYYITGSFLNWSLEEMMSIDKPGTHEGAITIGLAGRADFQIVRDRDWNQTLHPLEDKPRSSADPVMGPSDAANGKCWSAFGNIGEQVQVKLSVEEGKFTVGVVSRSKGTQAFRSGSQRRAYHVTGTFNAWSTDREDSEMTPDEKAPGIYHLRMVIGTRNFEEFQILVNGDWKRRLHPTAARSQSGKGILDGPDSIGDGFNWRIIGPMGSTFEIDLDLNQVDRRLMVRWRRLEEDY
jgi:polyketide synthase-associated protein